MVDIVVCKILIVIKTFIATTIDTIIDTSIGAGSIKKAVVGNSRGIETFLDTTVRATRLGAD